MFVVWGWEKEGEKMDAVKANTLAYTIKYAKSEMQYEPESPLITITLKRNDFKEIIDIAEKKVNEHGATVNL